MRPLANGRIRTLPARTKALERGCVRSTSRSALRMSGAWKIFWPSRGSRVLRLVCDTAALRGRGAAFTPLQRADVAACSHMLGTAHVEAA